MGGKVRLGENYMRIVKMIMIRFNDTKTFSEAFINTNFRFNLVGCEFDSDVFIIRIPERFTRHHTLLHTHMIQHTPAFFTPACHKHQKYCIVQTCYNIHNYAHTLFTRHLTLLHMTTFMHQTYSIQK